MRRFYVDYVLEFKTGDSIRVLRTVRRFYVDYVPELVQGMFPWLRSQIIP
jgi:hypothetical protein